MALDGWSLNEKIRLLREDLTKEMREMKIQFAVLYEYLKQMNPPQAPEKKKDSKKRSSSIKK